MDVLVREMTIADHEAVVALWEQTDGIGLGDSDSKPAISAFLERNPGMSFVAVQPDDKVVGTVLCGHDGRRGYLHHLAVNPTCRRRGLARRMIEHCFSRLGRDGIAKCNLFLFTRNAEGEAFWVHNGWQKRPDLVILQKPVPAQRNSLPR
jgi:putative acetyltransferase